MAIRTRATDTTVTTSTWASTSTTSVKGSGAVTKTVTTAVRSYGRYSNGGYSILGTILEGILGFTLLN